MRIAARAAAVAVALVLGACGFADSHAPLPSFMRTKETGQPAPEAAPDVKQVVHEQLDVVFLTTSYPRGVEVAAPHRELRGPGWTACIRAQLTSATGTALGVQTYIVTITGGKVVDRRRAEAEDNCSSETFEPI
ncbi:hypothetical protein I3J27_26030 [Bradyrhizobium xenonodulans]|uniref:Lipoprotein n=1 Tax=Bradyrhizobium xenonodulans TaxID=2736875 RepID=A0ABY7MFZ3_9BRAD|nr:hypothetical protein [Bradyrhizobium xenonodulans]WBL76473.1 hypothetical protein I3J27_26030 [Bradyrhizobium xenonodulans]